MRVLRRAWVQQYHRTVPTCGDGGGEEVRWREGKDLPPGRLRLVSPHDADARCGGKRGMLWDGYKVHYTESCDDDLPHLITSVAATTAAVDDATQVQGVHDSLARRELGPGEHLARELAAPETAVMTHAQLEDLRGCARPPPRQLFQDQPERVIEAADAQDMTGGPAIAAMTDGDGHARLAADPTGDCRGNR